MQDHKIFKVGCHLQRESNSPIQDKVKQSRNYTQLDFECIQRYRDFKTLFQCLVSLPIKGFFFLKFKWRCFFCISVEQNCQQILEPYYLTLSKISMLEKTWIFFFTPPSPSFLESFHFFMCCPELTMLLGTLEISSLSFLSVCSIAVFYVVALSRAHKRVIEQLREQLVVVRSDPTLY